MIDDAKREELASIGYLAGYSPQPERTGVTVHDEARAQPGYNLYTSGHAQAAYLTDMSGAVLHTWAFDGGTVYPVDRSQDYWRRVQLCDNGDLYACVDTNGIVKLNAKSELLWHTDGEDLLHHDFFVDAAGSVYAIGRRIGAIPDIDPAKEVIDDTVVTFDSSGKRTKRFSIYDAFRGTEWFAAVTDGVQKFITAAESNPKIPVETFHTNTIEVFDGSLAQVSPLLKKGNAVFCSPVHRSVFIIDLELERVVWNWFGPWKGGIHQPAFLPNGNFLLFHNGLSPDGEEADASHVFEYTFPGKDTVWEISGRGPKHPFFSLFSCIAQRLPNGNTLAVVSNEGRAIEFTPAGDTVWEFWNPNSVGADMSGTKGFVDRGDGKIIGTLFQLERVPREVHDAWLSAIAKSPVAPM